MESDAYLLPPHSLRDQPFLWNGKVLPNTQRKASSTWQPPPWPLEAPSISHQQHFPTTRNMNDAGDKLGSFIGLLAIFNSCALAQQLRHAALCQPHPRYRSALHIATNHQFISHQQTAHQLQVQASSSQDCSWCEVTKQLFTVWSTSASRWSQVVSFDHSKKLQDSALQRVFRGVGCTVNAGEPLKSVEIDLLPLDTCREHKASHGFVGVACLW